MAKRVLADPECATRLCAAYPVSHLRSGLRASENVVYRNNGNRSRNAKVFLKHVEKVAEKIGIDRVGDISYLSPSGYPVFQSCRPNLFGHPIQGKNTGSQGKGSTLVQAKISCLMEAIESYCVEPREIDIVCGSFNFLSLQNLIVDPRRIPKDPQEKVTLDERLTWTSAYSVRLDRSVLIPAESIFFPFTPQDYKTKSHFTPGSNGLSSGATYLEAAIHALYEVIERHYLKLLVDGKVECEAMIETGLGLRAIEKFNKEFQGEFEIQIYNIRAFGVRNLPVIMCVLMGQENRHYVGHGCSLTAIISIERALSEAFQSYSTAVSGSREDLRKIGSPSESHTLFGKTKQPRRTSLTLSGLRRKTIDRNFSDLHAEYRAICQWLNDFGCQDIFFANLTRAGVEIPVLKAVVPGLGTAVPASRDNMFTTETIRQAQYRFKK